MKTFQILLVKVARTPENEAILAQIRNKELFSADKLHNCFTGKKEVYFTAETTHFGLSVTTQRMLLRSLNRGKKALSAEEIKANESSQTMFLPIIIAKYLIRTKEEKETYTIEIEALTKIPFQAIHVTFEGTVKESAFKKAMTKMKIAKKGKK